MHPVEDKSSILHMAPKLVQWWHYNLTSGTDIIFTTFGRWQREVRKWRWNIGVVWCISSFVPRILKSFLCCALPCPIKKTSYFLVHKQSILALLFCGTRSKCAEPCLHFACASPTNGADRLSAGQFFRCGKNKICARSKIAMIRMYPAHWLCAEPTCIFLFAIYSQIWIGNNENQLLKRPDWTFNRSVADSWNNFIVCVCIFIVFRKKRATAYTVPSGHKTGLAWGKWTYFYFCHSLIPA